MVLNSMSAFCLQLTCRVFFAECLRDGVRRVRDPFASCSVEFVAKEYTGQEQYIVCMSKLTRLRQVEQVFESNPFE